jgi:hypothetical protein
VHPVEKGVALNVSEYAKRELTRHRELSRFFNDRRWGRRVASQDVHSLNEQDLKDSIRHYANSPEGPYCQERLDLYHEVCDLFGCLLRDGLCEKGYELDESFLSNEEIYLIMLKASHNKIPNKEMAFGVLRSSENTARQRRSDLRDGVRIGDMCVQADFGYGGSFESSAHPIMLPLNLSEVYVMLVALKKYELACGEGDPHATLAARLANMAYGELSAYAKKKLADRLSEAGYVFRPEGPAFRDDMHGSSEWVKFEKSGVRVAVELDEGQSLVGVIVGVGRCRGDKPGDRRPGLTLRLDDGSEISVPWSQVVSIDKTEG